MVKLTELSRRGRAAYWVVAALAWAGVAATLIITAFDGYAAPTYVEEGLFAGAPHGWAGAPSVSSIACPTSPSCPTSWLRSSRPSSRAEAASGHGGGRRTCARS